MHSHGYSYYFFYNQYYPASLFRFLVHTLSLHFWGAKSPRSTPVINHRPPARLTLRA